MVTGRIVGASAGAPLSVLLSVGLCGIQSTMITFVRGRPWIRARLKLSSGRRTLRRCEPRSPDRSKLRGKRTSAKCGDRDGNRGWSLELLWPSLRASSRQGRCSARCSRTEAERRCICCALPSGEPPKAVEERKPSGRGHVRIRQHIQRVEHDRQRDGRVADPPGRSLCSMARNGVCCRVAYVAGGKRGPDPMPELMRAV